MKSGSYSSWVIIVFLFLMIGSWFAPREWATALVLGSMVLLLVYVGVVNFVPFIRSSGKPFVFVNARTSVGESMVLFKKIRKTPGGIAVRRCEVSLEGDGNVKVGKEGGGDGKKNKIGALCLELEDEPFLYTSGADKAALVFPYPVEFEELFDYLTLETDFNLKIPVRLANMRGVLLGWVHEPVEDRGIVCRLLRRFRGIECKRDMQYPIIGVSWTRLDDIRALTDGLEGVREAFKSERAEIAGRWVDRLGRLHVIDTEKEVLDGKVKMLRNYISNFKKVMFEAPEVLLSKTSVGESEEITQNKWVWVGLGAGVTLLVVAVLAVAGVI